VRLKCNANFKLTDMCPVAGHCSIPIQQAIRACSGLSSMAIEVGGRMRKFSRKGGRRLGLKMTERKMW
jgi:hypothetical protein